MYAVIIESAEVLSKNGVMTKEGTEFLAVRYLGDTDITVEYFLDQFPKWTKTWETLEEAQEYVHTFQSDTWWCKPNGKYTVVPIEPTYVKTINGYKEVIC